MVVVGFARFRVLYAVATKMTKILTQFAPGGEQARILKIADGKRPDRALTAMSAGVGVTEMEFMLLAQGVTDLREDLKFARAIVAVFLAAQRIKRLRRKACRPFRRQGVVDFVEQAARGAGHVAIALDDDGTDAEDQRLDFVFIEHQRRQEEVGFVQDEADARLATDVRALLAQGFDVAVDGAQADAKIRRQFLRGDGLPIVAQVLQQGEEAVGAEHVQR